MLAVRVKETVAVMVTGLELSSVWLLVFPWSGDSCGSSATGDGRWEAAASF